MVAQQRTFRVLCSNSTVQFFCCAVGSMVCFSIKQTVSVQVQPVLRSRVQRYAEHSYANQQQRSNVRSIPMFEYLSEQLLSELQCELMVPNLKMHPLLAEMERVSPVSMQAVKHSYCESPTCSKGPNVHSRGSWHTHVHGGHGTIIVPEGGFSGRNSSRMGGQR